MIVKEESLKLELEACQCDDFLPFYKNANPSIFPSLRYDEENVKLEPIEV